MLSIRLASAEDYPAVCAFYRDLIDACAADPCFPPWEMGIHPTEPMLEDAISAQTLYVGSENGAICAAMIVNADVPAGYTDGVWLSDLDEDEYLVLHLLAVARDCRRKGLAGAMVRAALKAARQTGKRSLRLDAWDGNAPAHALYRSLGFSDTGMMRETYDDGSSLGFYLFEYPLGEENV